MQVTKILRLSILFAMLTITITAAVYADDEAKTDSKNQSSTPEAAAMFESLVQTIPTDVDATEVHRYVGKPVSWQFFSGNKSKEPVALIPFWVAERLYCVHLTTAQPPVLRVFRIHNPLKIAQPVTAVGKTHYSDEMKRLPEAGQILDLHAVVDQGAEVPQTHLSYLTVYDSTDSESKPVTRRNNAVNRSTHASGN